MLMRCVLGYFQEPSRERASSSPAVQHPRQRRRSDPTETRLTGDDGGQQQQQHHQQQQQQHHYEYEYDQRDFVAAYPNMFRANTTLQPLLLPLETMEQVLCHFAAGHQHKREEKRSVIMTHCAWLSLCRIWSF
jgi:hypothetical protein